MRALIMNIGNEVLSGKVINTNSSFIAMELSKIGIEVAKVIVVSDDENVINQEINLFKKLDVEILITTGGLGPTHDDLTKEAICKNLGLSLEINEDSRNSLINYFSLNISKCNLKQAYFPKDALILKNEMGTADGAIIFHEEKIYILLVGPPYEMMPMFSKAIIHLKDKVKNFKLSQEFIVMGNSESYFEELLSSLYQKYPEVKIDPYASLGMIRYQIIASENNEVNFNDAVQAFKLLMNDYIISSSNEDIETVVVKKLKEKKYTISFCESCTGGMLSSKIINVDGSSSVYNEGLITYSNESKVKYLGVSEHTLNLKGAVSEQSVIEMVEGLKKQTKANVCVSVSGIAGPSGGTIEKPVGLVYYAIKINDDTYVESKIFKGNRNIIRTRTTLWILYRIHFLLKRY